MKVVAPVLILVISIALFFVVQEFGARHVESVAVDSRPLVTVAPVALGDHQITLSEYGSLEPVEVTPLVAQVSGEVVYWNPSLIEGGRVSQGELLFSIEKDAYQAAYLQAEANLNRAQADLVEERALAQVAADEASRSPNRRYTDLFLRKPQMMSAEAAVKSAQAALRIAARDRDNCDVHAPYDALVVSAAVGLGQFLTPATPVVTLYNMEVAKVHIPVPGFDAHFLPDQLQGLGVAIERQGVDPVYREGRIAHDLGRVDEATRMTHVLVLIDDPYGLRSAKPSLPFGSYVKASFAGKTYEDVVRLPSALVNQRIVWVVNDSAQLEPRQVQILREEGRDFLISGGLKTGENLVTTLPEFPQAGTKVRVLSSSEEGAK